MSSEDIARKLCELEVRKNLFEDRIAGVAYWHLVREYFLVRVIRPALMKWGDAHPDMGKVVARKHGLRRRIKELLDFYRACTTRIKFLRARIKGVDVLFSLSPRTVMMPDGRRRSQYLDFFSSSLRSSYAILSLPGVREADMWCYMGDPLILTIPPQVSAQELNETSSHDVAHACHERAESLSEEIMQLYGVTVNVEEAGKTIAEVLRLREALRPWLRHMLRELKVKCVVTVVGYSLYNLILTEIAHEEGLDVLELQHGTVYPGHAAYNLPMTQSIYLPDHVLLWGEFWRKGIANCSLNGLMCVGFPFFDYFTRLARPERQASSVRTVLFVSQGTIGCELAETAVAVAAKLPPDRYRLIYKLHPSEAGSWRQLYPQLVDSSIAVEDGSGRNIYACFSDADAVVGVYSTAIVECVAWGIISYSLKWVSGSDSVRDFARAGYVRYAESVEDLVAGIETTSGTRQILPYANLWLPDAAENVSVAIDRAVALVTESRRAK